MRSITQFELAWELYKAGVNPPDIGLRVSRDRATVFRWLAGIKLLGIREFVRRKKECKRRRQQRKLSDIIERRIKAIRKKTGWCGQKIGKELIEKDGVAVSVPTIYRVLNDNFKLGKGSGRHKYRGEAPKATSPREVVQHDTVDFGEIYAHTSIDIFSKEPVVVMVKDLTAETGVKAFKTQKIFFGQTELHQSDEGSEFKGEYKSTVESYQSIHRYARPYRKNDQSFIENFNRSLRNECLGWTKYKKSDLPRVQARVDKYVQYFINERWHMGLPDMMTPAQFKAWYNKNKKYSKSRICA